MLDAVRRFLGRLGREYAYLFLAALLAVPAFVLVPLGAAFSVLSLLTVGLPLLAGVLALARGTIRYFRGPARWLLGWDWPNPERVRPARLLTDTAAWKALAYCLAGFPLKLSGAYLGGASLVLGPVFATYPLWWVFTSHEPGLLGDGSWRNAWWLALQGGVLCVAGPWFVRLLVWLDRLLAYALLTPGRARRRIAELEAGRAALQSDAAALMRRVERDLHDGTQARLVAVGVTLSRIARRAEPGETRELARGAQQALTEALTELRDIVRGLHPPALDDGLEVALASLAGRSAVPARLTVEIGHRPPDATASAVYFTAAELLTNVAKHAGATRAAVELREKDQRLELTVRDDGRGGARRDTAGTGLSGLARRARALDGDLTVDSPPGGPTTVTVTFARD